MSWFSEIAGKAEDLLNRVDQSAAEALQNKSKSQSRSQLDERPSESSYSPSKVYSNPLRPSISSNAASPSTLERKSSYSQSTTTPKRKSVSDDEKLLEFLNASDKLPASRKERSKVTTSPEKKNFQSINTQSQSVPFVKKIDANSSSFPKTENITDVHDAIIPQAAFEQQLNKEILVKTLDSAPSFQSASLESDVFVAKSLTVNQDVSQVENQSQIAETETKRIPTKVDPPNFQMSNSEKFIRELREREKDMTAVIEAKDSQLAILKVRLQEADQELHIKKSHVKELEAENDRLIKEHAQSAAFQNKTIEILREQLQQAEAELNKTKEMVQQNQNDHMQKIAKMEEEHQLLVDSYSSLQKKWNDLNEKSKDISIQLKQSNGNFEALQQEYNDYKQKAQRILQSKEKLIGSLKSGHLESDSIEKNEAASALANAEIESIKQERDLMRDELKRANELVATYRAEIQELEKASHNDAIESQERYKKLKDQLDSEKTTKEELQLLNVQLKEELQILREELTRTKSNFQSRIQDREIEIEKLRRQLTTKSLSSVSQDELESRLHALTENLIQKQTLVEALSTEKNSLILQRERLEQQLNEALNYGMQQHAYVGINNNESERKSKTVFLENPFDSALTRRVKRVYSSIDSFSIRLGVFFRRYPITRVFVIIYMLLLHFWVLIVLLTYEPEIHNASYEVTKIQ